MQFKPDEIEHSSSESKSESSYLLFQPQRDAGQGQGGFALLAKPLTGVAAEAIRPRLPGSSALCSLIKRAFKVLRTQIAQP